MQKISFCERYMLTTAVLNRTKELTRRLEKALERVVEDYKKKYGEEPIIKYQEWVREGNFLRVHCKHGLLSFQTRYKLGEIVAVAQAYETICTEFDRLNEVKCMCGRDVTKDKSWRNKLFVRPDLMPHQIQITGVRIEKLQAISYDDCLKEGITNKFTDPCVCGGWSWNKDALPFDEFFCTPREAFASLINRPGVGRKGTWESNPFVVVYEFKLIK